MCVWGGKGGRRGAQEYEYTCIGVLCRSVHMYRVSVWMYTGGEDTLDCYCICLACKVYPVYI